MPFITANDRQRRILQLSQEWDITLPAIPNQQNQSQRQPPQQSLQRRAGDDQTAEDLLRRRAVEVAQGKQRNSLSRAFSINNLKKGKGWDPKDIFEVLKEWIATDGSPGVAQALIAMLEAAGVDVGAGGVPPQKSGVLTRRRSLDVVVDRTELLRMAVERNHQDMVQVLVQYANSLSLDACLPIAINNGNIRIVDLLLSRGASAARTDNGQIAFRHACSFHEKADMVSLIVQSDGRPTPFCISEAMVDAASLGLLEIVLHLSRSTGDGNYDQARALKAAVDMGRRDIALALIMGNNPPQRPGLDQAFRLMFHNANLGPATKLDLAELLLCSGAGGDVVAEALKLSCENGFLDMAKLIVQYGSSIEYDNAAVVKAAISQGQTDLVSLLLNGNAELNPTLASQCVRFIPKQASFEVRYATLSQLLRRGANGTPLSHCLVDAAHAGDVNAVDLLVKPIHLLDRRLVGAHDQRRASEFRNAQRHEVASPDYQDGEALRTAVSRADLAMAQKILSAQPSAKTLSAVFPVTKTLNSQDRYRMVELFLKGALTGPCLHDALQDALNEEPSRRDDALVKLLLEYDADINFDQGRGLQSVIAEKNLPMLDALASKASPQTAAARVPDVMLVTSDHRARFDMMAILLRTGASIGTKNISEALLHTLQERPVDMSLLRLLVVDANADVNACDGAILKHAVTNTDPKVLEMVLGSNKLMNGATSTCLEDLGPLPSTEGKAWKLKVILGKATRKEDLDRFLVQEVQSLLRDTTQKPSYATLRTLLESGADQNAFKASVLCQSVAAAATQICDILLECSKPPTTTSLDLALPHALRLSDAMDRLVFTESLVKTGASPVETNRALVHAIGAHAGDLKLLSVLATGADTSDGEALQQAVSRELTDVLNVLLKHSKHTMKTRDPCLDKAVNIRNRDVRHAMCSRLLKAGVSSKVASMALLVAARDDDMHLCDELIAHGASVADTNGRALIEACRGGAVGIMHVLLKPGVDTSKRTLEQGFQAATEVRDLNKRATVFELLLKRGVRGEVVDAQLHSAARYGEGGEALLRVLLRAGADPNFDNGDAVVAATASAFIKNLELLLGLWDEENHQKKPTDPTLLRAFKACWGLNRDSRFQIVTDLIKAGLPVTEDLHIALHDAVSEEDPEERLVKLLLHRGASPAANGCKALIDATKNCAPSSLNLLLSKDLPAESINEAFLGGFDSTNFDTWFSDNGLETAEILLGKGAGGAVLSDALVSVILNSSVEQGDLADRFVDLLVSHGADVNHNGGLPLQSSLARANVTWARKLLDCHPSGETLSSGLNEILSKDLPQDEALALLKLLTAYHEGDVHLENVVPSSGSEPVVVRAVTHYPRSKEILETLLDAGYWYDQVTTYQLHPDVQAEEVTLLTWAIAQPQKRVSTGLIQLLLDRGAKVNVQAKSSGITPLMLAVQNRRPDVIEALLIDGAEVDVEDFQSRTPLSLATQVGGDLAVQMMKLLLAADPSKDDGSLHNAARELNLPAVRALIQVGHEPDFPSPLHDGRSALAELCLHGSDGGPIGIEQEKSMQKVMALLIEAGSDLTITSHGKSILHLSFDAADPVTTSRLLLKVGMWKHVNKPFNRYTHNDIVYSPTMYIAKILAKADARDDLLTLLRANRATDAYYAISGPQPDGAVGLPEDLQVQERQRQARQDRLTEESQEHALALSRRRELANVDHQIMLQRSHAEDTRRQKLHDQDLTFTRTRAALEDSLASKSAQRRVSEHRALAAAERDTDDQRQRKAIEWEGKQHRDRVDNARALSAIRISEREETERLEKRGDERMQKRLEAQRRLLEGQERLARAWTDGPGGGRRQIGYVTEET